MASHLNAPVWLGRVRHDLVKRMLWPARDCRELNRQPDPGELEPSFLDEEGQSIEALALWERLREDAPSGLELSSFTLALCASLAAAKRSDVEGVLALEKAFERLSAQCT